MDFYSSESFPHFRSDGYDDIGVLDVYDAVYGEQEPTQGETLVSFAEEVVSDQQTESDIKQLEGKHNMSLQQMKEQVIGSVREFFILILVKQISTDSFF